MYFRHPFYEKRRKGFCCGNAFSRPKDKIRNCHYNRNRFTITEGIQLIPCHSLFAKIKGKERVSAKCREQQQNNSTGCAKDCDLLIKKKYFFKLLCLCLFNLADDIFDEIND